MKNAPRGGSITLDPTSRLPRNPYPLPLGPPSQPPYLKLLAKISNPVMTSNADLLTQKSKITRGIEQRGWGRIGKKKTSMVWQPKMIRSYQHWDSPTAKFKLPRRPVQASSQSPAHFSVSTTASIKIFSVGPAWLVRVRLPETGIPWRTAAAPRVLVSDLHRSKY